ncbi:MAG: galactitol-1-phosphate 5-dehydrogenase [Rectinemataceae bacterium]|jgi:2-desacetyl-2-hydroxyethyl bacteriochlorophyllide A dehydrogenase
MRGLVYYGPEHLEMAQLPDPEAAEGEVLLKVKATGICGSDLHGYLGKTGRRIAPMVMGHEFAGEVLELGPKVKGFNIGDRVVVQPVIFCGKCEPCKRGATNLCGNKKLFGVMDLNGSMADFISVPQRLLYRLPENIDYLSGAMIEPLAVAYGATRKVDVRGKDVLIVGSGTIGLLLLQIVVASGPHMVAMSDVNDFRLGLAKKLGADHTINPGREDFAKSIGEMTEKKGFDVAFEAVGITPTVQQAMSSLKMEGSCVWVGNSEKDITLNMQEVVTKVLRIFGTYTYTHAEFGEALDMVKRGKVDMAPLISRVAPLEQGPEMFKLQTKTPGSLVKIILTE